MDLTTDGVAVKYIGHRPTYREGTYGSNLLFEKGETKVVPPSLAHKLLKHPDVYVEGKATKGAKVEVPDSDLDVTENESEKTQNERDNVNTMTKTALAEYAKTHYRVDLNSRSTVDDLRGEVVSLIDRFGAPPA